MANKRTYKSLTKKQTASVKRYTKAGKSQQTIAKLLGVSKQRIATSQRKAKVGKRRPSPFWKDVKSHQELTEGTWKESREAMFVSQKWGKKRRGAGYLSPEERYQAMRDKRAEFTEKGKLNKEDQKEMDDYGESIGLGDTPK